MSKEIIGVTVGTTMKPESVIDKTLADWAKASTKPTYTADEVGADPSGTASSKVSEHNTNASAHNDIRLLIEGLTTRLNTLANSDDTTLDQMAEVVAYIKANRTLIESVTTDKVNVADIINNLTTNVSNKPLSAAQGVALKGLIDALKSVASQSADGLMSKSDKTKLDGIAEGANKYTHPSSHAATMITQDSTHRFVTDTEKSAWNNKANALDIPTKYSQLTDDIGYVKTVNYVTPDSNGNVNMSGGTGITIAKSDTLKWDGETEGKVVVTLPDDPNYSYTLVSDAVPTIEQLQNGGSFIVTHEGSEEEEVFTTSDIANKEKYIEGMWSCFYIIKEDNVTLEDSSGLVFPKAGIYFLKVTENLNKQHVSKLTINNYNGFTNVVIRFESGTVQSDDMIYDGYVKVSNAVPSEEDVLKGGSISHYNVVDNKISGDLIVNDYLENCSVDVKTEGITIRYGVEFLVVISFNGGSIGGFTFTGIDSPGVYFKQSGNSCVHSFTIKDYTGFSYELDKIPTELLPDGFGSGGGSTGGGASDCDWNIMKNKPFGETTTLSNTLTWDGNLDKDDIDMTASQGVALIKLSDSTPTVEELVGGGTCVNNGMTIQFTQYLDSGAGMLMAWNNEWDDDDMLMLCPVIFSVDMPAGAMGDDAPAIPKGTYVFHVTGMTNFESCTFNSYQFKTTKLKTLDTKYLEPFETVEVGGNTLAWDGNTAGLYTPGNDLYLVSDAIPSYAELSAGAVVDLSGLGGRASVPQTASDITDKSSSLGYMTMLSQGITIITRVGAVDTSGIVYEKPGVYFAKTHISNASGDYTLQIHSLTINGYMGFTEEETKLKMDYLPESHQFGESIVTSASVTWDGSVDGKTLATHNIPAEYGVYFCHVSDNTPTMADFANGGKITFSHGSSSEFQVNYVADTEAGVIVQVDFQFAVALEDNATCSLPWNGMTVVTIFPKKGIYFSKSSLSPSFPVALELNGYTFTDIEIKTIDPKYLPEGFGGGSNASTEEIVQEVLAKLPTWEGGSY